MAARKSTAAAKPAEKEVESLFSKGQIIAAERFRNRRDLLNVILSDDKQYTIATVEQLMNDFLKGKVK